MWAHRINKQELINYFHLFRYHTTTDPLFDITYVLHTSRPNYDIINNINRIWTPNFLLVVNSIRLLPVYQSNGERDGKRTCVATKNNKWQISIFHFIFNYIWTRFRAITHFVYRLLLFFFSFRKRKRNKKNLNWIEHHSIAHVGSMSWMHRHCVHIWCFSLQYIDNTHFARSWSTQLEIVEQVFLCALVLCAFRNKCGIASVLMSVHPSV